MLMRTIRVDWSLACAAMLMLVSSCTPANEDLSSLECSKLNKTFFSKPTTVQMAEFGSHDVESQYAVFICGNQVREPPSIHLATPFAREGEAVVGFLKAKLAAARGDLTIRDILLIFAEMARHKIYDVAGDADLMRVIESGVSRMKDDFWRQHGEQSLSEIREQASTAVH